MNFFFQISKDLFVFDHLSSLNNKKGPKNLPRTILVIQEIFVQKINNYRYKYNKFKKLEIKNVWYNVLVM